MQYFLKFGGRKLISILFIAAAEFQPNFLDKQAQKMILEFIIIDKEEN